MIISREKYWKNVRKERQNDTLFLIYLDNICLRSDKGNKIKLPTKLADEVVREWNADGKIDIIKNSFHTKFCFSVIDMTEKEKASVVSRLIEYSNCDPLCYIADEPEKLHIKQKKHYDPLIDWVQNFFSIELEKGPSLRFIEQPSINSIKIKKFLDDLDNFHLAAINEITKSLGSFFICLALYKNMISSELAWEVANVEDNFRIEVWGEVEEETFMKKANFDHFNNVINIVRMI